MEATSSVDLARTRSAFDTWRASQPGRRRIPESLWNQALALLDRYTLSRVCRELRLSPKQLRQRKLSSARPLIPTAAGGPHFVQVRASDLSLASATSRAATNSRHQSTEANLQMIFERTDGSRLTLSLPSSDWDHITALCSSFMHG